MTFKRLVFSALISLALIYVAYPYITLYRLANAVSGGDADALASLVAWNAVREGVKEDICDAALDMPDENAPNASAAQAAALRPFGYSFVRGVAANVVDANITPEALVGVGRSAHPIANARFGDDATRMTLNWAFFESPQVFNVVFGIPGQTGADGQMRVQMQLRRGGWVVTRAWLPTSMLVAANSRT